VPVFAFEPAADTFEALTRNVLANDLGRVITPLQVALYDETAVRPLFRSSMGAGSALHALDEAVDYARRPFAPAAVERVMALRLDDLVRWFGVPLPTRIKIDVDGVEARVLAGAAAVLGPAACDIYIELVEAAPGDRRPAEVSGLLDTLGYTCRRIVEHRVPGSYPRVFDALFVPRSKAQGG
jgi:FkbM family methyltransferase